jgi:hypothetical protein
MPFTLSHAAAVLPFKKSRPQYFSLPALIVGSFLPDFIFYFPIPHVSREFTHSALGSVAYAIPLGLFLLFALNFVRDELVWLLPRAHRDLLLPYYSPPTPFNLKTLAIVCLSIFVGTWTHLIWDAFTHDDGWVVSQLPLLQMQVGVNSEKVCNILQHISTGAGFIIVSVTYYFWARERDPNAWEFRSGDVLSRRFIFWTVLATVSMIGALLLWKIPVPVVEDHTSELEKSLISAVIRSVRHFTAGYFVSAIFLKAYRRISKSQAARV